MPTEEIKAIAKEMAGRIRWLQEEGLALFRKGGTIARAPESLSVQSHDRASYRVAGPAQNLSEVLPVDPARAPLDQEGPSSPHPSLQAIREDLGDCQRCKLSPSRTQIVFGTGDPKADLMFVGEGPGQEEDRQGEPFVGRAGELLTKMISAMGLSRDRVYIANIIKCRPPQNRNPQPDEIAACSPFLERQIDAIRPKVICALGTFAAQTLLRSDKRISDLRGHFHDLKGVKVLPTFHPAYLLRSPEKKPQAWEDLQKIMAELGLPVRGRG